MVVNNPEVRILFSAPNQTQLNPQKGLVGLVLYYENDFIG